MSTPVPPVSAPALKKPGDIVHPGVQFVGYDPANGSEIHAFVRDNWQGQIDAAVAQLGPEDRGSIVAIGSLRKQQLAVVVRPFKDGKWAERFSVVGTLTHKGTTKWKSWDPEIAMRLMF